MEWLPGGSRVQPGLLVEHPYWGRTRRPFTRLRKEGAGEAKAFEETRGLPSAGAGASCREMRKVRLEGSLRPPRAGQELRSQMSEGAAVAKQNLKPWIQTPSPSLPCRC